MSIGNLMENLEKIVENIGANFKKIFIEIRTQNKWTQEEFAKILGLGIATIRRYETQNHVAKYVSIELIYKLSEISSYDFNQLVSKIYVGDNTSVSKSPSFQNNLSICPSKLIRKLDHFNTKDIKLMTEVVEIINIYLSSKRISQLDMFLDIARQSISENTSLKVRDISDIRILIEDKMKEWREVLKNEMR